MTTTREYKKRINRVIDYINENIGQDLSLNILARVALFSPFHFHRIFKAMVNEPLNDYIRRLRLEKGANVLINNPYKSITELALDCGFASPATFARAFKGYFSCTPSEWRNGKHREYSKNGKIDSKNGNDFSSGTGYNGPAGWPPETTNKRREDFMKVEIKEMPALRVIYVRHFGGYDGVGEAWAKLFRRAGPRGLIGPKTKMLGVSYDNPDITPNDKCRYDACMTIPENTAVDGEIGLMDIPGGKYAVYHYEGTIGGLGEAYDRLYGEWLPQSGYQPENRPCYELYYSNPDGHPERKFACDICIPVLPL